MKIWLRTIARWTTFNIRLFGAIPNLIMSATVHINVESIHLYMSRDRSDHVADRSHDRSDHVTDHPPRAVSSVRNSSAGDQTASGAGRPDRRVDVEPFLRGRRHSASEDLLGSSGQLRRLHERSAVLAACKLIWINFYVFLWQLSTDRIKLFWRPRATCCESDFNLNCNVGFSTDYDIIFDQSLRRCRQIFTRLATNSDTSFRPISLLSFSTKSALRF